MGGHRKDLKPESVSLGKGGPGSFSHFLGPRLCSKYSVILWCRGTAWNPPPTGLTATPPSYDSAASHKRLCGRSDTHHTRRTHFCSLAKGVAVQDLFPCLGCHAPAISARFLSCTDGPHLRVGRELEASSGWFSSFGDSLIRKHSVGVGIGFHKMPAWMTSRRII